MSTPDEHVFEVGDLAVIIVSDEPRWPVGKTIEILGPLEPCYCGCGELLHHIGWEGYVKVWAPPSAIRKKTPPGHPDSFAHWDDCPWWPEKIVTDLPA